MIMQRQGATSASSDDVPRVSQFLISLNEDQHDPQPLNAEDIANNHQLTHLSACLYDMFVLLERIKRDFYHYSHRKDCAQSLIAHHEELPGADVLAALNATAPIITGAVETNVLLLSSLRDMISAMMQVMDTEVQAQANGEPTSWTRSDQAISRHAALPKYNNAMRQYATEGTSCYLNDREDIDAVAACDITERTGPHPGTLLSEALTLTYHADITGQSYDPPLYANYRRTSNNEPDSRRVLLGKLPPSATIAQVLQGIRCCGGVISITLTKGSFRAQEEYQTALVEFVYPNAAAEFAFQVNNRPLIYRDGTGHESVSEAHLVPTQSYVHTNMNHSLLQRGCTRSISMPSFPVEAIWHLIRMLGREQINRLQLDGENCLTMEFISLFEAHKAETNIRNDNSGIQYNARVAKMHYVPDTSQGAMEDVYSRTGGVIDYVDPGILDTIWNQAPYNKYPYETAREPTPIIEQPALRRTPADILAEHFSVDAEDIWTYLEDRRSFKDTTYRIIGSNITLTRRKWSWDISAEDDTKLLMANTLHDPDWADEWDKHFKSRGLVNIRTWEQYGMLARHRRDCVAEQGLCDWMVPTCEGCGWGCRNLKQVPMPQVAREFLERGRGEIAEDED